jgi:hypothetical protein
VLHKWSEKQHKRDKRQLTVSIQSIQECARPGSQDDTRQLPGGSYQVAVLRSASWLPQCTQNMTIEKKCGICAVATQTGEVRPWLLVCRSRARCRFDWPLTLAIGL